MNNIDDMWPICHDCPYWEVCEPPYICEATREKQSKAADETDLNNTEDDHYDDRIYSDWYATDRL